MEEEAALTGSIQHRARLLIASTANRLTALWPVGDAGEPGGCVIDKPSSKCFSIRRPMPFWMSSK